jgi:lipoprotein NlpI
MTLATNIILFSVGLILIISFFTLSNYSREQTSQKLYDEGVRLFHSGKSTEAVDKLSDAIEKETANSSPDKKLLSNMHCIRGEVYLSIGVAVLSQSDFTNALQYNPDNESALNNLGIWFSIARFNTPDYNRALEYFDKAISIQPDRKDIQLNKACVKIQSGDKTGCDDLRKLDQDDYPEAKIALERFCKD